MKIRISFKTPDAIHYALEDAFGPDKDQLDTPEEVKKAEERQKAQELMERFIEYGENVTLEFDTESGTATVLPR